MNEKIGSKVTFLKGVYWLFKGCLLAFFGRDLYSDDCPESHQEVYKYSYIH